MLTRFMGRSEIEISAMGMGCWAIGGPFWKNGEPVGWGDVNDDDSIRAIQRAFDMGITFFDTAAVYGCGHSERVLAQALAGRRNEVVIATKFGQVFDEATRQVSGYDTNPESIQKECEASLKRLNTDHIDLYQCHVKDVDKVHAIVVRETLENLVTEGKIRYYGWSTDDAERARIFSDGPHCTAIQQRFNIFEGEIETLEVCEKQNLASINRSPLGMGLLTGKFSVDSVIPADDVRSRRPAFLENRVKELEKLATIQDILTQGRRTLAQGALCWLWARSKKTIPIPGFKTTSQVEENANAMQFGPLTKDQMHQIDDALLLTNLK
jgi:aryl-alcohol dehydrogenase-like predicted oxidoreductase